MQQSQEDRDSYEALERLRRRSRTNSLWFIAVFLFAAGQGIYTYVRDIHAPLRCEWSGQTISLEPPNDGPFVVTHLAVLGEKKSAALVPPVAILDSEGGTTVDVGKLDWRDVHGEKVAAPDPGTPVRALYYVPLGTGIK